MGLRIEVGVESWSSTITAVSLVANQCTVHTGMLLVITNISVSVITYCIPSSSASHNVILCVGAGPVLQEIGFLSLRIHLGG